MTQFDKLLDAIEHRIVELENENINDPRIQELLDLEADIVLREYYASREHFEVQAWMSKGVYEEGVWLDE